MFASVLSMCFLFLFTACSQQPANSPYPDEQSSENIYYSTFSERPKHLDPAISYSSNEYQIIAQIYEPPLQYHFLQRPYQLTTLTAKDIPQAEYLDAEGNSLPATAAIEQIAKVRYRIHIRPGIYYQPHPAFAKGVDENFLYHALTDTELKKIKRLRDFPLTGSRELTAADYVYQIKRLVHPQIHSPMQGLMNEYIDGLADFATQLQQVSLNEGEWLDLRKYPLAGAEVVDRYTYDLILQKKYPQFIYWLAMPFFAPIPWEADRFYAQPGLAQQNISLDWYPLGTGPYLLAENNPNRRMLLQRNPNFWNERYPTTGTAEDEVFLLDSGKEMPFINTAIFSLEPESIPAWNKFLQGYYDTSGIVSDSFDQAIQFSVDGAPELTPAMQGKGLQLLTATTLSTFYMGFNMADEVVGGLSESARLLRQAISIAVNYEEYINIFANGRGHASHGPLPPGIFGHRAVTTAEGINSYVYQWENSTAVRRSITEAKALLEQAGYKDGRDQQTGQPLILYLDTPASDPGSKAMFDWFRKQFAKLKINLVVRSTDYNRFQEKMRNGTAQIFMWGWNADYPDPENFLFLLYGKKFQGGISGTKCQ